VATGVATGPLYAWKHDGKLVPGWPVSRIPGAGYSALGDLGRMILPSRLPTAFEVFSGHTSGQMGAWWGNGTPLMGWPRQSASSFLSSPASLTDIDDDARDEIFLGEEDDCVHGYRADGTALPGWPVCQNIGGGHSRLMPTIADLDGDGTPEFLITAGTRDKPYLYAYHPDGSLASGFPVLLPYPAALPVVGDVDGDGELDIVMAMEEPFQPFHALMGIHSRAGVLKHVLRPVHDSLFVPSPSLADFDGDGFPEIILETDGALDTWKGDGSVFPGWPRVWSQSGHWLGNSAAVVGDVDGDGQPDIVITTQYAGRSDVGEVHVYDRFGNLHPHFPKVLPIGLGAVPAIADIDRDGRNEIIVTGAFWNGFPGMYDKVWVYDLGGGAHGPVLWGQFMGGPRHQGRYEGPPN
jgi:VCBS repeat protein